MKETAQAIWWLIALIGVGVLIVIFAWWLGKISDFMDSMWE